MSKVKIEYQEYIDLKEKVKYLQREVQRLNSRNNNLEGALLVAEDLIPKKNIPVGVGANLSGWLINQGKNRTWICKED